MDDYWDRPILKREQMVLFPTKLDEAVPRDHEVRLFDEILRKIDWSDWEERYPNRRGRPPIHPRIMARADDADPIQPRPGERARRPA
mgnify:CR=1 FL=1